MTNNNNNLYKTPFKEIFSDNPINNLDENQVVDLVGKGVKKAVDLGKLIQQEGWGKGIKVAAHGTRDAAKNVTNIIAEPALNKRVQKLKDIAQDTEPVIDKTIKDLPILKRAKHRVAKTIDDIVSKPGRYVGQKIQSKAADWAEDIEKDPGKWAAKKWFKVKGPETISSAGSIIRNNPKKALLGTGLLTAHEFPEATKSLVKAPYDYTKEKINKKLNESIEIVLSVGVLRKK